MKIVILDSQTLGEDIDLTVFEKYGELVVYETTNDKQTASRIKDANIVLTNKVVINQKHMQEAKSLKLICITATGMDNIDTTYAKNNNIEVKNVAGYSTYSVMQTTIHLVLKFIQNLDYYDKYTKDGKWHDCDIFTNLDSPFSQIKDKNWGIIGLGEIGKAVANVAVSLGANISYYSTTNKNHNTQYEQKTLERLLKQSDIITIHCGLNDMTYNLLNKTNLNMIKNDAILVNVGRGGIINEEDLVEIFNKTDIKVALDVIEKEPIDSLCHINKILNSPRFILTPHIGWSSKEARQLLIKKLIANIDEFVL
ncbi:MAG: D-2-hydroxyacid dehydrogenase [Campylobacterota bacterium]